jgi:predicted MFS family arabinose efflux permease
VLFAPRFHRHQPGQAATVGYAVAALAFAAVPHVGGWGAMAALHAVAGFGAGIGLSFTHGTIGRSARPHRLFAIVNIGLGVVAIVFLGAAQALIPQLGGGLLFNIFAAMMALAAIASGLAFPRLRAVASEAQAAMQRALPITVPVWWAVAGMTLMTVCQSMLFSFVERIGFERGFGERVVGVLIALGFVNLLPAALAALLERRLPPLRVGMAGVCVQAVLALTVTLTSAFLPYAGATSVFVAVQIFTHTFIFGWLAHNDRSGRAVALTPAMLMSGAAIGPLLGGVLTSAFGIDSLGFAVLAVDCVALACFARALAVSRLPGSVAATAAHTATGHATPAH